MVISGTAFPEHIMALKVSEDCGGDEPVHEAKHLLIPRDSDGPNCLDIRNLCWQTLQ